MLLHWLKLPETRNASDLDSPARTVLHGQIIQRKWFLHKVYEDFYTQIRRGISPIPDDSVIIELGSGGGFIKEFIPQAITSEVIDVPGVDRVFSAMEMPFDDHSVDAFCMIDVFHHLPDVRRFFAEAYRCLKGGGKIVMIEPANTVFSRLIYRTAHHEPFDPDAREWSFDSTGPVSDANGALAWMVFCRDRQIFVAEYPDLEIIALRHHTPLVYLLSGGLTWRQFLPDCCYGLITAAEWCLSPLSKYCGMFMTIELQKNIGPGDAS